MSWKIKGFYLKQRFYLNIIISCLKNEIYGSTNFIIFKEIYGSINFILFKLFYNQIEHF